MKRDLLIVRNISHEGPGLLEELLQDHQIGTCRADLSIGDAFPDPAGHAALVVLGGPQSANDGSETMRRELEMIGRALDAGIPYLGICLGMQALVKAGGGRVVPCREKETGFFDPAGTPYRMELTLDGREDPLFRGLGEGFRVFQLHGETIEPPPTGMRLLGRGEGCPWQAVRLGSCAYGLQCHFELTRPMLEAWAGIDPDLGAMDRRELLGAYDDIAENYRATGIRILSNFLSLSGLL